MTHFDSLWALFGLAWCSMVLTALALSILGVIVVARGHILLAIATSQAAACGAACAMAFIGFNGGPALHGHSDVRVHLGAFLGGILGTALGWRAGPERSAIIYTAGSVIAILAIAQSPYGLNDILMLQHSNALTAGVTELLGSIISVCLVIGLGWWFQREVMLLAIDEDHARVSGMSVRRWNIGMGGIIGLLISFAVSSFGLLYAFGFLIIPALITISWARSCRQLMLWTPVFAGVSVVIGIIVAHGADIPPGQAAVAAVIVLGVSSIAIVRVIQWIGAVMVRLGKLH